MHVEHEGLEPADCPYGTRDGVGDVGDLAVHESLSGEGREELP